MNAIKITPMTNKSCKNIMANVIPLYIDCFYKSTKKHVIKKLNVNTTMFIVKFVQVCEKILILRYNY